MRLRKCEFLKAKITFLGHTVDRDGIHTMDDKIKTNTISEFTFSNTSEFENAIQDSLPLYLTPYVHYPSIIASIVLIIIIVIPLCCVVKKALTGTEARHLELLVHIIVTWLGTCL